MTDRVWDPVLGRWRQPPSPQEALRDMVDQWRASAVLLQGEIDAGIALRQSVESKAGRVAALNATADQLERFVKERWG